MDEQTRNLKIKIAQSGDIKAQQEVLDESRNLIHYLIQRGKLNRYLIYLQYEDLAQECILFVADALKTFDPSKSKWSTWAVRYILYGLRTNTQITDITIGRQGIDLVAKYNKFCRKFSNTNYKSPNDDELLEQFSFRSLKTLRSTQTCLSSRLKIPTKTYEYDYHKSLCDIEDNKIIKQSIKQLRDKWQYVIKEHYYKARSIKDIANELQVSVARVGQIRLLALKKLKRTIAKESLNYYT